MKKENKSNYGLEKQSNALSADSRQKRRRYRRNRKIKKATILTGSLLTVILATILIVTFMNVGIIKEITVEAGSEAVNASEFFENSENIHPEFFMCEEADMHTPGVYKLRVRNGLLIYNVRLNVVDTVPPKGKVKSVTMKVGDTLATPDAFVKSVTDETKVTVGFKGNVNFTQLGDSPITVVLTDAGGNEKEYTTRLTIFPENINSSLTVEAGTESISVADFLTDDAEAGENDKILTDEEEIKLNQVGKTSLEILLNDVVYTVTLKVKDTIAPKAYIINKETYQGKEIPASDFVRTIFDETQVTVSYKKDPDFKKVGAQTVTLVLQDEGNNTTEYKATLYVNKDTIAPTIKADNRTVYIGDNIKFTQYVTAEDNNDDEVKITVDPGDFDKTKPGRYPITFTATDNAGNSRTKTVYFTLKEKSEPTVSQAVIDSAFDELYNELINDDMGNKEKMRVIYDYIRENIEYTGTSDKRDWEQEAYRGITTKGGDSFTYYSVARKLLTMIGVTNKGAQRINGQTLHYWNLVKYNGKWYHIDACPHYKDYPLDSFMLTDNEVKKYSKKTNGYYDYEAFE